MAYASACLGAALCWNALLELDHWRDLPELSIPNNWRRFEPAQNAPPLATAVPTIQVQPNPASEKVWVSYDADASADELKVFGPTGRLISVSPLAEFNGLLELEVKRWAAGLYLATILREGVPLAEVKFMVTGNAP